MSVNQQLLHVTPGCRVRFNFKNFGAELHHSNVGVVQQVQERIGRTNNGQTRQNPLVTYVDEGSGETRRFDLSYATEILSRPTKAPLPRQRVNIYRNPTRRMRTSDGNWIEVPWRPSKVSKGVVEGELHELIMYCLGSVYNIDLEYGYSYERASTLFKKQTPGLQEDSGWGLVRVRIKPFKRWVQANAQQLVLSKREADAKQTEENTRWEKDMQADMDREFFGNDEWDDPFGDTHDYLDHYEYQDW